MQNIRRLNAPQKNERRQGDGEGHGWEMYGVPPLSLVWAGERGALAPGTGQAHTGPRPRPARRASTRLQQYTQKNKGIKISKNYGGVHASLTAGATAPARGCRPFGHGRRTEEGVSSSKAAVWRRVEG